MLENHAHFHAGLVDVLVIFLVQRGNSLFVFLALALFKQIFRLDLGDHGCVERRFVRRRLGGFRRRQHSGIRFALSYHVEMQIRVYRRQKLAFQPNFSVSGRFQKVHTAQKGALSAPGRSHDNDLFALFYLAADAF